MTANNEPETKNPIDNQGEVRPSAGKDGKLEDKIADEKDALVSETASEERQRDS